MVDLQSGNGDFKYRTKFYNSYFSMAAEIERELISSWTKEVLAVIKKSGVKLGRPKGAGKSKLDKYKPEIEALLANGSTQKFIANRFITLLKLLCLIGWRKTWN